MIKSSVKKVAKRRGRPALKPVSDVEGEEAITWPKKRGSPAKNLSETVVPARKTRSALAENNI